jgi:hypothetical protein
MLFSAPYFKQLPAPSDSLVKRFAVPFHYVEDGTSKVSRRSLLMSIEFATVQSAVDHHHAVDKTSHAGDWEVHFWGDDRLPGMAAVSAIATLQLGATLTDVPEEKIAMSKAAEYLIRALAPQLKTFRRALATD